MAYKLTAVIGLCLTLAACGGGGGGGGGFPGLAVPGTTAPAAASGAPAAATPVITFSPDKLTGNQQTGISATYVVKVNVTQPEVFSGDVYAVVQDPKQILRLGDGLRLLPIDRTTYAATLNTSGSLPAGRHQGSFSVSLCKDAACAAQYPGSPVSLPYDITVTEKPLVAAASLPLRATAYVGGANPPDAEILVDGPPGNWKASSDVSWLKVMQTGNSLPTRIKVRYLTQDMATGLYDYHLVLQSSDGQEVKIKFTLEMLPAQFQVSTEALAFTGVNGATIPAQTLRVDLKNRTNAPWTASTAAPWLLLEPGAGSAPALLTARIASQSGLVSGIHATSIALASPWAATGKAVGATLSLTRPTLSATTTSITLGGPKGRDEIAQSLAMSLNTGNNKWPWTLSAPLPAWVSASAMSGNVDASGATLSFSPVSSAAVPGTHAGLATVTAKVNGDTLTLPVNLVLNRDKRQLLPSEWGVGFADVPGGAVLSRTLRVTETFGTALPWTATSSAAWLSVTSSGTAGIGAELVLTANPALASPDSASYATVTLKSTNPDVAPAVINVGLWRAGSGPAGMTTLPMSYTHIAADKFRPYIYVNNDGASIDIYNAHLGTQVGSIANVGVMLAEMAVAADGSKLYAIDVGSNTIVVIDLATGSKLEAWPLEGDVHPELTLLAMRTNGKDIVIDGNGTPHIDGWILPRLPTYWGNLTFAASSDGRKVFAQTKGLSPADTIAFDVDYSAMSGGTLMVKTIAGPRGINGAGNGADIAVNADATALYTAAGAPYRCSSANPANLATIVSLPGGDAYPNNVEVTSDGRVICGISGWYSSADIWVHASNGTLLKSFKFAGYARNLLAHQLVVTPDGMVAVGLTSDPRMAFVPIGTP